MFVDPQHDVAVVAFQAVRQLQTGDGKLLGGITIWLRAGDNFRTAALELSDADSVAAEVAWLINAQNCRWAADSSPADDF